jgi:hypothetical protein
MLGSLVFRSHKDLPHFLFSCISPAITRTEVDVVVRSGPSGLLGAYTKRRPVCCIGHYCGCVQTGRCLAGERDAGETF